MSDPRLTPDPDRIFFHQAARIIASVVDLKRDPSGARDRQLIYGDAVTVLNRSDEFSYIQSTKDRYCGYVANTALGVACPSTHRICNPATHAYTAPDFKSAEQLSLTFGSGIIVTAITAKFAETELGYIPIQHIAPYAEPETDPAAIAAHFLGTPYLWGGNSRWGIDCSGLVQAALLACAIPCPADSDLQHSLGVPASGTYNRNDLLFWKGHVALVTDSDTLIHANANTMSTNYEPIDIAIARIQASGDGPVTAHRRL
jgi:cell wall-associated NlpC family hydrolase